jgi:hypothetical protein
MLITDKKELYEIMRQNDYPFWELTERSNANLVRAKSPGEDTLSIEKSIEFLDDHLRIFKEGDFRIKLKKTLKDSRGGITLDFRIGEPEAEAIKGSIGGISPDEVNQRIAEAIERVEERRKMSDLEEELRYYRDNNSGEAVSKFFKALTPYVPNMMGQVMENFTGKKAVAGPVQKTPVAAPKTTETALNDQESSVAKSLKILFEMDPNMASHLESLARKAQEDPEKLKSILPHIDSL